MGVQDLEEMELPHLLLWEEEPSLEVAVVLVVSMCQVVPVLLVEAEVVVLVLSLVELMELLTLVVEEDLPDTLV